MNSVLVFLCFLPYPAYPVGGATGIQFGHIISIYYLIKLFMIKKYLPILFYVIIVAPIFLSTIFSDLSPREINSGVAQIFGMMSFVIAYYLIFSKNGLRQLYLGVAWACILHAVIGIVQQLYYLEQDFPFINLYINPSFAEMEYEKIRTLYGVYTKRSFGLFPEPSSMMASLAPWFLVLLYLISFGKIEFTKDRKLYVSALLLMLVLFYFSGSGALVYLIIFSAPYFFYLVAVGFRGNSFGGVLSSGILILIVPFVLMGFYDVYSQRKISEYNQVGSWDERKASIEYGLQLILDASPYELIFGYGSGRIPDMTWAATGASSIHSWIVAYSVAGGVLSFFTLVFCFLIIVRNIFMVNKIKILPSLLMFIVSISLVTGYFQLLPLWVFFGYISAISFVKE